MDYRDADGIMRRESTGCREKQAAQKKLADVLADVEKVQTGIITASEKQIADHAERPLRRHVEDYLQHLSRKRIRGRKVSAMYRKNLEGRIDRLIADCGWRRLRDITRERMTIVYTIVMQLECIPQEPAMKFVSVRDLRGKSAQVWQDLDRERELVITSNGKPIAIVSATDEAHFEQSLRELRQARALRAVKQLQERSVETKADKLSKRAIEDEIAATRRGRRR